MGGTPEIYNTNNPDHRVFAMLYTFYARFGVPSQTNKGKKKEAYVVSIITQVSMFV